MWQMMVGNPDVNTRFLKRCLENGHRKIDTASEQMNVKRSDVY